jgi:hypothetical protein
MGRASVSRRSCLLVVPEAISEWNPEQAPQAIVMNSMGTRLPALPACQDVNAG